MFRKDWIPFVLSTLLASSLAAAPPREGSARFGEATEAAEAPVIDGRVEEEVWQDAELLTDFVQAEPREGQPATEKTEVRVLYDNDAIYIGVICHDSEPDKIVVTDSRRDSDLSNMDSFQVIFDTYLDRQNGFVFGTNPAGIEYDGQVTNEGETGQLSVTRQQEGTGAGFNLNWDASWRVRTHINQIGWMAEFAIPLRTLRYGSEKPQTWGVNFYRSIRRKREEDYWSPVARIYNLYRLSSAGELRNLKLESPRNFKVTPYVLGDAARDYALDEEAEISGEVGVDAKFGVTPSLNLDMTYNTDFAQVEVDEQQINLTRFNLFFPEKRPFFLENAGIFSVGKSAGRDQALELFFSRRIGIGPDGELVPIVGGARMSGKAGEYNVGLLNMQTEDVGGITPANNFTVARFSREFRTRSNLGGIFINRSATGSSAGADNWNRTWGVDGKIGIGDEWTFDGFAARTETPGAAAREYAWNAKGEYKNRLLRFSVDYAEVGEDFNPEVGYLLRGGYRSVEVAPLLWIRTPSISWLRELRPHVTYRAFWDFTGFMETEYLHLDTHVDFESGAHFSPAVNITMEGLKEPFEIYPGIVIPPGNYRDTALSWKWNTNMAAPIAYEGELDWGEFYTGTRHSVATTVSLRKGSRLNVSARFVYNDINLKEGRFIANLGQLRFNFSFTPFIYIQSLVQYNDRADVWSANLRFSWLNTAGTGLFIVYNDTRGLGDLLIGPQNRSFIVKYTRQFDILK